MGRPKAALPWGTGTGAKTTVIGAVATALLPLFRRTLVVARNPAGLDGLGLNGLGVDMLTDDREAQRTAGRSGPWPLGQRRPLVLPHRLRHAPVAPRGHRAYGRGVARLRRSGRPHRRTPSTPPRLLQPPLPARSRRAAHGGRHFSEGALVATPSQMRRRSRNRRPRPKPPVLPRPRHLVRLPRRPRLAPPLNSFTVEGVVRAYNLVGGSDVGTQSDNQEGEADHA